MAFNWKKYIAEKDVCQFQGTPVETLSSFRLNNCRAITLIKANLIIELSDFVILNYNWRKFSVNIMTKKVVTEDVLAVHPSVRPSVRPSHNTRQ